MTNVEKLINLKCKATGIGSIPHTDINAISDFIIKNCPDLPYWPQSINIDPKEGMLTQYIENLPCIKLDKNNEVFFDKTGRDEKLLEFFEHLTSGDYNYFKISKEFARGFYTLLDKLKNSNINFIKGQVVGPVTLLYSIKGEDGKSILFDEMLSDAIIRGLAMKGVWQAKEIKKTGKEPVIFFDEPAMSGFGSAFMPLNKSQAMAIFDKLIDTIKEHEDVITGIHCCGNSDWEMLLQTKIDIINFDAFEFLDNFILYSGAIKQFLHRGGIIAWGAVPTSDFNERINLDLIVKKITDAIEKLASQGIEKELLLKRAIFTPACGMGSLNNEIAEKIIDMTNKLALHFSS
jgi:methionine synthase II (cobalamin-independent)